MSFVLTNEMRKSMGISLIKDTYEMVAFNNDYTLIYDKDILKKVIISNDKYYHEYDTNMMTANNKALFVMPKNKKEKKINKSSIDNACHIGTYIFWCPTHIIIGNYSNDKTYYTNLNREYKTVEDFQGFCNNWVEETTLKDIEDVNNFSNSKREKIKYQEGDYFVCKLGRREYCFGQVLLDLVKIRKDMNKGLYKDNLYGFKNIIGSPVLVKIFKVIKEKPEIDIEKLNSYGAFPSEYVLDNNLYYGTWKIFAHTSIESKNKDYLIQFGRSNNVREKKLYLQEGFDYIEKDYEKIPDELMKYFDDIGVANYSKTKVGFYLGIERYTREYKKCIIENRDYYDKYDLRNPLLLKDKEIIYKYFHK